MANLQVLTPPAEKARIAPTFFRIRISSRKNQKKVANLPETKREEVIPAASTRVVICCMVAVENPEIIEICCGDKNNRVESTQYFLYSRARTVGRFIRVEFRSIRWVCLRIHSALDGIWHI